MVYILCVPSAVGCAIANKRSPQANSTKLCTYELYFQLKVAYSAIAEPTFSQPE